MQSHSVICTFNCSTAGCYDYPAYYNPESGECVLTCPPGTIGSVNRTSDGVRNCTSCKLIDIRCTVTSLLYK